MLTPTDLALVSKTGHSITIEWADQSGGLAHHILKRREAGDTADPVEVASLDPGTTQGTFAGLDLATEYDLFVCAWDGETEFCAAPIQVTTEEEFGDFPEDPPGADEEPPAPGSPDPDGWITYGTGRCSGLDELQGPGRFRIQISDESWVGRKGELFGVAGTTSIWPSGVLGHWKGYPASWMAKGEIVDQHGADLFRLRLEAPFEPGPGHYRGRKITDIIRTWVGRDLKPPEERGMPPDVGGNWKHLRVNWPADSGQRTAWEIITFGSVETGLPQPGGTGLLGSLEEPLEIINPGTVGEIYVVHVWIRWPGFPFQLPAEDGLGYLWAPTAPPDGLNPLHLGVSPDPDKAFEDHPWSAPPEQNGFMHIADVTRRYFAAMGQRANESALDEIEADLSFPAIAPRVFGVPSDPERWMKERIWGPNMVIVLRDRAGRRKLKDIRPPPEDFDLSSLPVLDGSSAQAHRWKLAGGEQMNSILWNYDRVTIPGETPWAPGRLAVRVRDFPRQAETLDWFITDEFQLPPVEAANADLIQRRPMEFDVRAALADPFARPSQLEDALNSGVGLPWQYSRQVLEEALLDMYQDGPQIYSGTVRGLLAEQLEEGDYVLINEDELRGANPATAARSGMVLALILSLTRHPDHADYEAIRIRPAEPFPEFEDPCPEDEL